MLILNANEVEKNLPMPNAIAAMREAFLQLHLGKVNLPQRTAIKIPSHEAVSLFMPAYIATGEQLGIKIASAFPHNPEQKLPTIFGVVILFDGKTGQPKALLEGASLTAIRTGAVCGLATDLLARSDAESLAMIGSGVQAKKLLEAICCVRNIKRISVYSRQQKSAAAFVAEMEKKINIAMTATHSAKQATQHADIICTATPTETPIIDFADVKSGVHINAVGSYNETMRELGPELLQHAYIIVDQKSAALAEAGEIMDGIKNDYLQQEQLRELGEVIANEQLRRSDIKQITIFKSVGLAIQDVSAAEMALAAAMKNKSGKVIEI